MSDTKVTKKAKVSPLSISLFTVLVVYCAIIAFIFAWMIITASKDYWMDYYSDDELIRLPNVIGLPKKFALFTNLKEINNGFPDFTLVDTVWNSILYSVGCALSKVTVTCLVAYLCARYENWFSRLIYSIVVVSMIIPIVGSQAAEIQMAMSLGLHNKIWGMWVMRSNFLGLYFLVFYAVFKSMPKGYYEAAKIDGANDMQIMCRMAFPLVKYTFWSIFLIVFIEYWNDYLVPNLFIPKYPTLSLALWYQQAGKVTDQTLQEMPYMMTSALLVTVPMVVLFAVFSKRLMGNLSVGGLKG